ncbi:unnamed protein product [Adineta ricciae]|uniref:Uncharacterized protein n=1 Tax=Adineta ricciae TaxID=249248 RepID=A0A816ECB7_ADIRI|nr:unnamed protein product [Adineta ricciae]
MSALKEAGQLAKSGFKGCASAIRAATVGGQQVIGQFTKNGWKLVGEQIVHAFTKAGAKEVIKTVLDKTVLAEISKKINQEITENIQTKVDHEVQQNEMINKFLIVNIALQKPHVYNQEIDRLVCRILHPQSNRFVQAAKTIASGILNRLTNGVIGRTLHIITAGKCLGDLLIFLDKFLREFNDDLVKMKDQLKIDYLLHSNKSNDMDKRTAKEIAQSLNKQQYIDRDHVQVLKLLELPAFKLTIHEAHQVYVMNLCNNIYTETMKHVEYAFEKNLITQTITTRLADYMTSRLNAELINPLVHAGVDATVDHLANKIEQAYADSRETLEERIRNRRAQNDIIRQGEFLQKRTRKQQSNDRNISPQIQDLASAVENDAPGDLKDIIAVSAKLGRPVQVYRNGKYDLTIGDPNSGEPLKVNFEEGQMGNIGHYTDANGNNGIVRTGATDCLFDVLSAQTNMTSNELRQVAAAGIRENSDLYLKMMPSLDHLKQNPDRSLLYAGGDNTEYIRAKNHSGDSILDDKYLPSRKILEEGINKVLAAMEDDPAAIKGKLVLETIIHDIYDEDVTEVIARDKQMRDIFYYSLNGRLAYFKMKNEELFAKSDTLRTSFNNVASYWKGKTHPQADRKLYYSQAYVNANFSKCDSWKATDFLPQPVRNMIASQRIETAGKEAIVTYGPAVAPVQFFSHCGKLVAIDNRMTLAHELAKVTPQRLIPAKPSETELNRMKKPGIPSENKPKHDKNA